MQSINYIMGRVRPSYDTEISSALNCESSAVYLRSHIQMFSSPVVFLPIHASTKSTTHKLAKTHTNKCHSFITAPTLSIRPTKPTEEDTVVQNIIFSAPHPEPIYPIAKKRHH